MKNKVWQMQCDKFNIGMWQMLCDKCDATNAMWQMQCDQCDLTNWSDKFNVTNAIWQMQCDKCNVTNALRQTQCDKKMMGTKLFWLKSFFMSNKIFVKWILGKKKLRLESFWQKFGWNIILVKEKCFC